jgi:hypothetical protein
MSTPHCRIPAMPIVWILAVTAMAVVCIPGPALGADRVVLCEKFTATT